MSVLETPRLVLVPVTLHVVEAVLAEDRAEVERLAGATFPNWPGRALIERAFAAQVERIRDDPSARLWGDRLMITREKPGNPDEPRLLVGSVIFHGAPTAEGVVEVGYGVEESSQGKGFASEATRACVEWAITQPGVRVVRASTPPWHTSSIRVLENSGLERVRVDDHEALGEVLIFERRR